MQYLKSICNYNLLQINTSSHKSLSFKYDDLPSHSTNPSSFRINKLHLPASLTLHLHTAQKGRISAFVRSSYNGHSGKNQSHRAWAYEALCLYKWFQHFLWSQGKQISAFWTQLNSMARSYARLTIATKSIIKTIPWSLLPLLLLSSPDFNLRYIN